MDKPGHRAPRRPRRPKPAQGRGPTLQLKKPLERVIAHGSPWVYTDALREPPHDPGTVADLLDTQGRFLARGLCEAGPIGFRVLTLDRNEAIDAAFWTRRVASALSLREHLPLPDTNAYRLLHGEADRLPGVVVDRYDAHAVVRLDGVAAAKRSPDLLAALLPALAKMGIAHVYRVQGRGPARKLEVLAGQMCKAPIVVLEHGMKLVVDLVHGQKTGMFLDHRESRRALFELCQRWQTLHGAKAPLRVLNLYAYTGGFSIAAGLGGATQVTSVDISAPALEMAQQSWEANGLDPKTHQVYAGKAEHFLGECAKGSFDVVVADPPSFAPSEKAKHKALGAYRAMHRESLGVVRDEGLYLTASCSSHVDRQAFEATLREGAHAAQKSLQILARWGAGGDHPVLLGFGAGDYLCAVLSRVLPKR